MTEMDALRLRVAARAYRATRPSEAEVDRGVRRTLSAMRRSQIRRRASLTPAIIVAILAFGTLAYANPNSVRRWMSTLLLSTRDSVSQQVAEQVRTVRGQSRAPAPLAKAAEPVEPSAALAAEASGEPAAPEPARALAEPVKPTRAAVSKTASAGPGQRATWAEVNTALASQDTPRALAALGDLSRHGDAATRAKAELGLAQLLWSRGDRGTACSIANKLIQQKSTPARVQERARALVQGCGS